MHSLANEAFTEEPVSSAFSPFPLQLPFPMLLSCLLPRRNSIARMQKHVLFRLISIKRLPPSSPSGSPNTRQLHPPLLLLMALGRNAQLVRAPNPRNNGVKALTLGAGRATLRISAGGRRTNARAIGSARSGVAFPHADTLVFGGFFGVAEAVESAILCEEASVPLSISPLYSQLSLLLAGDSDRR